MRALLAVIGLSLILGIGKLAGWFLISWFIVGLPLLLFFGWLLFLIVLVFHAYIVREALRSMDKGAK